MRKFVRAYMTKRLRKAIMKRSELKSKYLENKNYQNMKLIKSKKPFAADYIRRKEKILF